jgi:hypothetical protein
MTLTTNRFGGLQAPSATRLRLEGSLHPAEATIWCALNVGRPQLFPPTSEQALQPEVVNEQLELDRAAHCHPLSGIHTEDEWREYKAKCAAKALTCSRSQL